MIIWGGDNGNFLNSGAKYFPLSDTWVAISNGITQRRNHTATWSGPEMIVWGGQFGVPINSGGRYNPTTDVWTIVAEYEAPSKRYHHSAMWSGNRMVIFGGRNTDTSLGLGSNYDPNQLGYGLQTTYNAYLYNKN